MSIFTQHRSSSSQQRSQRGLALQLVLLVVFIVAIALMSALLIKGSPSGEGQPAVLVVKDEIQNLEEETLQANATDEVAEHPDQIVETTDSAAIETAEPPATTQITFSFAGDTTLGTDPNFNQTTSFNAYYDKYGPGYFLEGVKPIFEADDLTVLNLECVLTESNNRDDKEYAYKGRPEFVNVLTEGSVEAVTIHNNHSADFGSQSRQDTRDVLNAKGITNFGYGQVGYHDVKGVKVAFISDQLIGASVSAIQPKIESQIKEAQDQGAQVIVVFMHWGTMREYSPNQKQMDLGKAAIDAGATLVVGSHPHVTQGYEKYNGRYIVYSLGNFAYGGRRAKTDWDCYIYQQTFTVSDTDVATDDQIKIIPCQFSSTDEYNDYRPMVVTDEGEKDRILQKLEDSNAQIAKNRQ